jgi:hypothetical protein
MEADSTSQSVSTPNRRKASSVLPLSGSESWHQKAWLEGQHAGSYIEPEKISLKLQSIVKIRTKFIKNNKVYSESHFQRWMRVISERQVKKNHCIHAWIGFYRSVRGLEHWVSSHDQPTGSEWHESCGRIKTHLKNHSACQLSMTS